MSDPFVGEIRLFAGNFAPRNWALCDGQLLSIAQNDTLFSLFGTVYGGDGRTTFGLPDLRGRVPIHVGQGPGLIRRSLGQRAGAENEVLSATQVAAHRHDLNASSAPASDTSPGGNLTAASGSSNLYGAGPITAMDGSAIAAAGAGSAHTNLMPTLCVNFIVALFGVYPSRN